MKTRLTAIQPGDVFDRLTVVSRAGTTRWRHATWLCQCSCGKQKVINGGNLISGNTGSCGCKNFGKKIPFRKPAKQTYK